MIVEPKETTRRALVEVLLEAATTRKLAPATASKYRGKSTWIGSHLMGRVGRVGQAALKQQQYGDQSTLDEAACRQVQHHACVLAEAPPRTIKVLGRTRRPLLLYTDAEYTPGSGLMPRLGWVLLGMECTPVGQTLLLEETTVDEWQARDQQIFPAEVFAGLASLYNLAPLIVDQNLIWFIDNESAAAAVIRVNSTSQDVQKMVEAIHLLQLALNARI